MTKQEKKSPAYTDLDPMPFEKHRGVLMQDVPAHYFNWLKEQVVVMLKWPIIYTILGMQLKKN